MSRVERISFELQGRRLTLVGEQGLQYGTNICRNHAYITYIGQNLALKRQNVDQYAKVGGSL